MIGWPGSFASVNTIAMRVVSAATTNGPRSLRKLSTPASATFCSSDLFSIFGIRWVVRLAALSEQAFTRGRNGDQFHIIVST